MLWSVHLEGGPRRVNHAAAAVGDRIYSFGGYCKFTNHLKTCFLRIHNWLTNIHLQLERVRTKVGSVIA